MRERSNDSSRKEALRKAIAGRVRRRRESLKRSRGGYTLADVAAEFSRLRGVDITMQAYNKYETGENEIATTDLPFLAEVLGVSLAYFYGEETEAEVDQSEEIALYNGLRGRFKETAGKNIRALADLQADYAAADREDVTFGKQAE